MSPRIHLRGREPVETQRGENVLAALRRAGLGLLYSCEEGCCQSCILRADVHVPLRAQAGLPAALRAQGAFLACQCVPDRDLRVFLPGEEHVPPVAAEALVLAGGRSSRMGQPKDQVRLADGRTMLDWVLESLRPLGLPVALSTSADPTPEQRAACAEILPDLVPHEGPLAAVLHALDATAADGLLVVCCDQPLLRPDLLRRLLPQPPGARAVFHRCRGESMAPFPGYFPRAALADLRAAFDAGERSPRHWAAQRECEYVDLLPEEAGSLQSVNTPEELSAIPPSPR